MTPTEPSADSHPVAPSADEGTGLSGLRSWNALYIFVVAVFFLWVILLRILTRTFS